MTLPPIDDADDHQLVGAYGPDGDGEGVVTEVGNNRRW